MVVRLKNHPVMGNRTSHPSQNFLNPTSRIRDSKGYCAVQIGVKGWVAGADSGRENCRQEMTATSAVPDLEKAFEKSPVAWRENPETSPFPSVMPAWTKTRGSDVET